MEIVVCALCSACFVLLIVILSKLSKLTEFVEDSENNLEKRIEESKPADYSMQLHDLEKAVSGLSSDVKRATDNMTGSVNTMTMAVNTVTGTLDKSMSVMATKLEELDKRNTAFNSIVDTRLEQMRATVEEKLQSTLETRLASSFKTVGDQLEKVYTQLGEMQSLAKGVDNLERVLTNVKARGIWGELQAERILQEILLPEQYLKNVATKKGSRDVVEFAVKLPGATEGESVLLPIDSKFPREDYEKLCTASENGDTETVKTLKKALERRISDEAKDIRDKYIDVPATTDFAVLFLPIEGLYAEVLSIAGLQERVQHEFHVMIAGPATLASLLNSLQMGFRTLAIEKKSSEVWHVLGEVKTEYVRFGTVLDAVKKKLNSATNEIDNAFTRHRAMGRKLKGVEAVESDIEESQLLIEDSFTGSSENQ